MNRYRSGPGSPIRFLRSKARGQHPNQENNVDDEVTTVLGSSSNRTTGRINRSKGCSPHHDHMEDEDVTSKKKVTYAPTPDVIKVTVSRNEDNNLNENDKRAGKNGVKRLEMFWNEMTDPTKPRAFILSLRNRGSQEIYQSPWTSPSGITTYAHDSMDCVHRKNRSIHKCVHGTGQDIFLYEC